MMKQDNQMITKTVGNAMIESDKIINKSIDEAISKNPAPGHDFEWEEYQAKITGDVLADLRSKNLIANTESYTVDPFMEYVSIAEAYEKDLGGLQKEKVEIRGTYKSNVAHEKIREVESKYINKFNDYIEKVNKLHKGEVERRKELVIKVHKGEEYKEYKRDLYAIIGATNAKMDSDTLINHLEKAINARDTLTLRTVLGLTQGATSLNLKMVIQECYDYFEVNELGAMCKDLTGCMKDINMRNLTLTVQGHMEHITNTIRKRREEESSQVLGEKNEDLLRKNYLWK